MRVLALMFFVCSFSIIKAQDEELHAVSGFKNDTVFLRWVPASIKSYSKIYTNGAKIEMIPWGSGQSPVESDFTNNPIKKVITLNSLKKTLSIDSNSIDTASLILNDGVLNLSDSVAQQMTFVYMMLYASVNQKIRNDLRLGIQIHNPFEVRKIAYRILIDQVKPLYGICTEDLLNDIRFDSLKISQNRFQINLIWNQLNLSKKFSAYNLYRRKGNSTFIKVNKTPIFHFSTEDEKNKINAKYIDKNVDKGNEYSYFLRGIDHFGHERGVSNTVTIRVENPLSGNVVFDSLNFGNNGIRIKARYRNGSIEDLVRIKSIGLMYSEVVNGDFKLINKTKFQDSTIVLKIPNSKLPKKGFLKLLLISNNSDTLKSDSKYYFFRDSIPPEAPKDLIGNIDSSGRVSLEWKSVPDKLLGFRIFRKNSIGEEFMEITTQFVEEKKFVDSISLNNLTSEIYYAIMSTDENFNNSKLSEPLMLMKPDLIAPVASFFLNHEIDGNGIQLEWRISSSKDFDYVVLQRKTLDSFENVLKTDNDTVFTDLKAQNGESYSYKLITFDQSGNSTESKEYYVNYELGYRKPPEKLNAVVDREKHTVRLNWRRQNNIFATYIYMAIGKGTFRLEKSIFEYQNNYNFERLKINNTYHFKIQTMNKDGILSKMSESITVDY